MPLQTTLETRISINAPLHAVWQVLAELPQYRQWNSQTHFSAMPKPGKWQIMRVKLLPFRMAVPVIIQHCDIGQGLRWQGGIPGLITGSHYFRLEAVNDQQTQIIQGETFRGILTPLMMPLLNNALMQLYNGMNKALKNRCESGNYHN